jgi:ribosomal protein L29
MKMKDIRSKTSEELKEMITSNRVELLMIRSSYRVQAQAVKPHIFKEKRKDNARAMTILSERER